MNYCEFFFYYQRRCFQHSELFDTDICVLIMTREIINLFFFFFLPHTEKEEKYGRKRKKITWNRVCFFVIRAISTEITTATGQTGNQIAGNFSWLGSCIMHRSHVALYFVRRGVVRIYNAFLVGKHRHKTRPAILGASMRINIK